MFKKNISFEEIEELNGNRVVQSNKVTFFYLFIHFCTNMTCAFTVKIKDRLKNLGKRLNYTKRS